MGQAVETGSSYDVLGAIFLLRGKLGQRPQSRLVMVHPAAVSGHPLEEILCQSQARAAAAPGRHLEHVSLYRCYLAILRIPWRLAHDNDVELQISPRNPA
jgi:hypothetical protein